MNASASPLVLPTRRGIVAPQPGILGPGVQQIMFTLAQDCAAGKAGEQILMAVTPADTNTQTEELDTYLGGYAPDEGYVADLLSPVVLIDKEKGQRRDFDKENAYEPVETRTGRQGAINEIKHLSSLTAYETEEHALAAFIPWAAENDAATLYNVRAAHSEMIADKLALAREIRVITLLTTLGSWATTNRTTLTGSYQWDTGGSKAPRLDLHTRIKASAGRIRLIAMNPDVAYYFLSDTEVRNYMKQMMGDGAPSPEVARASDTQGVTMVNVVGYPPIVVCPAKSLDVSAGTLGYILADDVVLVGGPATPPRDGRKIASSYTFRTRGKNGTGWTTNEYAPYGRGLEGGTMFEAGYKETGFVASSIVGGLIKDVLSTV